MSQFKRGQLVCYNDGTSIYYIRVTCPMETKKDHFSGIVVNRPDSNWVPINARIDPQATVDLCESTSGKWTVVEQLIHFKQRQVVRAIYGGHSYQVTVTYHQENCETFSGILTTGDKYTAHRVGHFGTFASSGFVEVIDPMDSLINALDVLEQEL